MLYAFHLWWTITKILMITTETQLVEISSRIQILESGDLLMSNVRETDAGLYTCVRSNEAGTVNGEAYLSVLGKCNICIFACCSYCFYNCLRVVRHQHGRELQIIWISVASTKTFYNLLS